MPRWQPNVVVRLQEAAMELYRDPGYDKVVVAEIAARAGVTRRTFFRYFADKREVLFFGTSQVEALVVEGTVAAPVQMSALEAAAAGLAQIARLSDEDPVHAGYARQRHAVIQANVELRERELSKAASLGAAIAGALRTRGVADSTAKLAAHAALAAFAVGFERWVDDPAHGKLEAHVGEATRTLATVVRAV
jgi:AcrR family transcriptional regulator